MSDLIHTGKSYDNLVEYKDDQKWCENMQWLIQDVFKKDVIFVVFKRLLNVIKPTFNKSDTLPW